MRKKLLPKVRENQEFISLKKSSDQLGELWFLWLTISYPDTART